jgi:hypothetical protein
MKYSREPASAGMSRMMTAIANLSALMPEACATWAPMKIPTRRPAYSIVG